MVKNGGNDNIKFVDVYKKKADGKKCFFPIRIIMSRARESSEQKIE